MRTKVAAVAGVTSLMLAPAALPAEDLQSAHYALPRLVANGGSGYRIGSAYQVSGDVVANQPVEMSASSAYRLHGHPLVTVDSAAPTCGIYISHDAASTGTINVILSLVCSHPSGCTNVQLSNNGVVWSGPEPEVPASGLDVDWSESTTAAYVPSMPWTLAPNDGLRRVFARYQNGNGVWSGACWDSILLDTTAPQVSLSPTGGTYMSAQSIAVTASEPATIKYTADGSDPTTSPTAQVYASPVSLADDATLKAFATDSVGHPGPVASESYEICAGENLSLSGMVLDATRDNAPMPLVVITLDGGQQATTTPAGAYSFTGLARGWYSIVSVTSPVAGYVTYQSRLKLCDASVAHDIVLTKDATVYGRDTSAGYSADGVNTSTGNFAYKISDLALPGRGPSVTFDRAYNSQDRTIGPLGYGWTWNYNITLTQEAGDVVVVRWGDGKIEVWGPDGSGGYKPMYGVFSKLIKNPDNTFTLRRKDLTEYRFSASNRLGSIVDEFGNTIAFSYSGSNLTSIVDTAGRTVTLSYDAANRITNVLEPVGRSVTFAYDGAGNLVTATDMAGKLTKYTYDTSHRMLTLVDPKGNTALKNTYDDTRDVVVRQRDALGDETTYVYDVPNRTTTIIDGEGNSSYHHFDNLLRLTQEEDARGKSAYRTYGTQGNVESAKDKNEQVTSFTYDSEGNVLTKTEPLGRVTTATYDASNNPLTKTDARGHSTVFEYDPVNGNLVAQYACGAVPVASCTTDPTVAKTAYTYDPVTGQLLTVTEAAGHATLERTTTYQYDVSGNRVGVVDALTNASTYVFDGAGRKLSEAHPLGRATAYEYDAMDRLLSVSDALGGESRFTYDDNGNKTVHRDAKGNETTFGYDAKDRLVTKTDALSGVERYQYDAVNRRTGVTNARGAEAQIVYDAVGNAIQEVDGLGNVIRHEYDGNGNRTATVDARGARSTFVYDALNHLVEAHDPLGNVQKFEYDTNGNKTKSIDPRGKATLFTYDDFDRLLTVIDSLGNTTTNTYDLLGPAGARARWPRQRHPLRVRQAGPAGEGDRRRGRHRHRSLRRAGQPHRRRGPA